MKEIFTFTADEVRALRENLGCSMHAAKRHFEHRDINNAIDAAETVDDLKGILKWLMMKSH